MGPTVSRWRRDAVIVLCISVSFTMLAAALLIIGRVGGDGWDALDYLVYAIGVGVLCAVVVVGYLIWVVIRDGWQISSLPAALVLTTLVVVAVGWAYREHAADADCRAASAFYRGLAAMPAEQRTEAIAAAGTLVQIASDCAIDGFQLAFGRPVLAPDDHPALSDAERAAVLTQLLDAGMPPSHRLLYGFAVDDADAECSRMLLRRRKRLNAESGTDWELFPEDIVRLLLTRARTSSDPSQMPFEARYQAVLSAFVDEGVPDPLALSPWMQEQIKDLDQR